MIHRIATVSPHRVAPFLFQAALFATLIGLSFVVAALRFLNRAESPLWLLVVLAIALYSARGLFGQVMLLVRSMSPGRPAVWEQNGDLVYLSPLFARVPLREVAEITQKRLRRGFGLQDYAVVTTRNGRRIYIHLAVIGERFDHLKEMIEDEARALA